jgi:hypothetical protein
MTNALLRLIASLTTARVEKFGISSTEPFIDDRKPASVADGANVVTSKRENNGKHAILLDLDIPAFLVPSSTPGHSHLYIDANIPEDDYLQLVTLLSRVGVIEHGYAKAALHHKATTLRLPWAKKESSR